MSRVIGFSPQKGWRVLALLIGLYLAAWGSAFLFVSREFGVVAAIALSLMPVFPLAVAVRMCLRWPAVRQRELAFLLVLVMIAAGSVVGVVWDWYATGMNRYHAEDLEYAAFSRTVRKDPAFLNVELWVSPKHIFWMRGTLASDPDLARLRTLANQCRLIQWGEKLEVTGPESNAETR